MASSVSTGLGCENQPSPVVRRFFSGTGPTYDHMVNLTTLGFDRLWKNRILEKIPAGSAGVMDQACGTGILTFKIARRFPGCHITGVDVMDEYLSVAKEKAKNLALSNIRFILGRAEEVLPDTRLDCITSSYLAKYADLPRLVQNAGKMLRRDGVLVMHDFLYPPNHVFARIWQLYFTLLQSVGTWMYPNWRAIFDGLPVLLRQTRWVTELVGLLREKDFSGITIEPLTFGTSAIVSARKK